jgi:hypothetical protein
MAEELDKRVRMASERRQARAALAVAFEVWLAATRMGEPAGRLRAAVEYAVGAPLAAATAEQLTMMARLVRLRAEWRQESDR